MPVDVPVEPVALQTGNPTTCRPIFGTFLIRAGIQSSWTSLRIGLLPASWSAFASAAFPRRGRTS